MADVLSVKAELGIKTRAAYLAGNTQKLKAIAKNDYTSAINKLRAFHAAFRKSWFFENKLHGFDVQDSRLGGLIMRLECCRDRLLEFCENTDIEIKHLNADRVVVTTKENIVDVLKEELENGHGVDVAIDCLGGEIMGKCIHYLTHGARWIMIAALAGQKTEIDLKNIYVRNVRIVGSTLRSRTPAVKAEILADLVRDVWPKVSAGEVRPTIYKVLPITEAEAAHDILYRGENVGKVVLTI